MKVGRIEIEQVHFAGVSAVTTAISSVGKLAMGAMTGSYLSLLNGAYLFVLVAPRAAAFVSGVKEKRDNSAQVPARQTRRYQFAIALSLIALGSTFALLSDHVSGSRLGYTTIPAITFATFAFVKLGMAIYGLIKLRGSNDILVRASKLTNLADGMASLVLTQMALRQIQGEAGADIFDRILGILVGIAIASMGLWYLRKLLQSK